MLDDVQPICAGEQRNWAVKSVGRNKSRPRIRGERRDKSNLPGLSVKEADSRKRWTGSASDMVDQWEDGIGCSLLFVSVKLLECWLVELIDETAERPGSPGVSANADLRPDITLCMVTR